MNQRPTPTADVLPFLARLLQAPVMLLAAEDSGQGLHGGLVRVAWQRVDLRGRVTVFGANFNPGMPVLWGATQQHGMKTGDVQHLPDFRALHPLLSAAARGVVLVGAGARTQLLPRLDHSCKRHRLPRIPFTHVLDLYDLVRGAQGAPVRSLQDLAARYGIYLSAHAAAARQVSTTSALVSAMLQAHAAGSVWDNLTGVLPGQMARILTEEQKATEALELRTLAYAVMGLQVNARLDASARAAMAERARLAVPMLERCLLSCLHRGELRQAHLIEPTLLSQLQRELQLDARPGDGLWSLRHYLESRLGVELEPMHLRVALLAVEGLSERATDTGPGCPASTTQGVANRIRTVQPLTAPSPTTSRAAAGLLAPAALARPVRH